MIPPRIYVRLDLGSFAYGQPGMNGKNVHHR